MTITDAELQRIVRDGEPGRTKSEQTLKMQETVAPAIAAELLASRKPIDAIFEVFGPMLRMIQQGATLHLTTRRKIDGCEVMRSGPVMYPDEADELLRQFQSLAEARQLLGRMA